MDYQNTQIAEIYDLVNSRSQDTDFYLSLAGLRPCRVLDLGCGTGTLCCDLAERGHRVTGIEPAGAMLAVAKRKPHAEQVEWVECSAQSYKSHRRFDLIVMTGHAFQVLLTDADALAVLETMRGHLKERGRIAFETRNPRVDWVGEWSGRQRLVGTLAGGQLLETMEITGRYGEFISFQTSQQAGTHQPVASCRLSGCSNSSLGPGRGALRVQSAPWGKRLNHEQTGNCA